MGLFKPYSREETPANEAPDQTSTAPTVPGKKKLPTPSRKEAEAARRQRLHPKLTPKERRAREAEMRREDRMEAMAAIENSPGRRIARKSVDSTWHITEFMLPIMLVMMALMYGLPIMFPQHNMTIQIYAGYFLYGLIFAAVADVFLTWRRTKRMLAQEAPNESRRGLMMYGMNRQMLFRRFRQPPAVKKSPVS